MEIVRKFQKMIFSLAKVKSFLCSFHKFHSETSAFQFISFAF